MAVPFKKENFNFMPNRKVQIFECQIQNTDLFRCQIDNSPLKDLVVVYCSVTASELILLSLSKPSFLLAV